MINAALIGMLLKSKADEILKGNIPDELKQVERTETKIVLVPAERPEFTDMVLNRADVSITYKGVEINLQFA